MCVFVPSKFEILAPYPWCGSAASLPRYSRKLFWCDLTPAPQLLVSCGHSCLRRAPDLQPGPPACLLCLPTRVSPWAVLWKECRLGVRHAGGPHCVGTGWLWLSFDPSLCSCLVSPVQLWVRHLLVSVGQRPFAIGGEVVAVFVSSGASVLHVQCFPCCEVLAALVD